MSLMTIFVSLVNTYQICMNKNLCLTGDTSVKGTMYDRVLELGLSNTQDSPEGSSRAAIFSIVSLCQLNLGMQRASAGFASLRISYRGREPGGDTSPSGLVTPGCHKRAPAAYRRPGRRPSRTSLRNHGQLYEPFYWRGPAKSLSDLTKPGRPQPRIDAGPVSGSPVHVAEGLDLQNSPSSNTALLVSTVPTDRSPKPGGPWPRPCDTPAPVTLESSTLRQLPSETSHKASHVHELAPLHRPTDAAHPFDHDPVAETPTRIGLVFDETAFNAPRKPSTNRTKPRSAPAGKRQDRGGGKVKSSF
ncbi:hypothetical protein QBC47DRAFT_441118 [Echria macrotheca]|uniref:Uncharacterized protein n=1 Tax=Echria macrotheca TaxID=438768 RepID=A0AAJ0BKB5_9PEZI|nr:hypothetical protein QBC47DRAFT_441118 [Echria macrotheca]